MVPMLSDRTPRHPGRILKEEFLSRLPRDATQSDIAERLGMSRPRLCELLHGKRSVTPDTALRLSRAFGTTPEFWMTAQARWDLYDARRSRKRMRQVAQIEPMLEGAGETAEACGPAAEVDVAMEISALRESGPAHRLPDGYYREFLEAEGLLPKAIRFARIRAQLEALDIRSGKPRRNTPGLRLPPRSEWFTPGLDVDRRLDRVAP